MTSESPPIQRSRRPGPWTVGSFLVLSISCVLLLLDMTGDMPSSPAMGAVAQNVLGNVVQEFRWLVILHLVLGLAAITVGVRARESGRWRWAGMAFLVFPICCLVWIFAVSGRSDLHKFSFLVFLLLPILQLVLGVKAMCGRALGAACVGALAAVAAAGTWFYGAAIGVLLTGSAWGRPLRVRGRQIHPELRSGSDWTAGERPDPTHLDEPTRCALAALWLHDAQKEHASVPAFSRISWQLAAAGAPADLLVWSHRAALEEIEHARACFALAAGYEGRSHTVEPMPDLLLDGLQVRGNVLEVMAKESLGDGCQLEDYNADVAAACAEVCQEPVTRAVLERIAVEERSHAEFSWALLHWLLAQDAATVRPVLERTLAGLARYRRPTAVSFRLQRLVGRADPAQLLRHGRLPDARWAELWQRRLDRTRERLGVMLGAAAGSEGSEGAGLVATACGAMAPEETAGLR